MILVSGFMIRLPVQKLETGAGIKPLMFAGRMKIVLRS
jgi:hypothetical protein